MFSLFFSTRSLLICFSNQESLRFAFIKSIITLNLSFQNDAFIYIRFILSAPSGHWNSAFLQVKGGIETVKQRENSAGFSLTQRHIKYVLGYFFKIRSIHFSSLEHPNKKQERSKTELEYLDVLPLEGQGRERGTSEIQAYFNNANLCILPYVSSQGERASPYIYKTTVTKCIIKEVVRT